MNAVPLDDDPLRILIVEESAADAEPIKQELHRAGFECVLRQVRTIEGYRVALGTFEPHLVVARDSLPSLDRGAILSLALHHAPTSPVILTVASLTAETMREVLQAGAADCISVEELQGGLGPACRSALAKRRSLVEREATLFRLRRDSEALHAIVEQIPIMVLFQDGDGRPLFLNREFERLSGWNLDEAAGIDVVDEIVPDPEERARFRELMATADAQWGLFKLKTREGRTLHATFACARLVDGTRLTLGQDVSDLRTVDERLATLSLAVESSPVSVVITDREGSIEYVNRKFTEVTGYDFEEAIGQNPRILKSEQTPKGVYTELWATITTGREWRGEICNKRKDGSLFWERASISGIRNEDGLVTHFIAVKEDISERRRSEEALRASQQQLLQSAKMEAIGSLAGGVAHDFNNLLGVIQGYSELVLKSLDRADARKPKVEQVLKAASRAADLTRQLLAFSRKQVLELKVVSVETIVADTEKMLRRLIGEDVEFRVVSHGSVGQVRADAGQIEQVLVNLAVNARDAMPQGGTLTIDIANVETDESSWALHPGGKPGSYVVISVSDTGMGMDKDTQAHIFEPFFTTKEKGKGTGLGLATVYGIVKQSGGYIWVYSEAGRGSTFKIYLPRVVETPALVDLQEVSRLPRGNGEVILLVEDDPSLRELVHEQLHGCGYSILSASHGAEALEIADREQGKIDLLLTDVVMPGLNGRDVAEQLSAKRPGLKLLFMSGYSDEAISHRGILNAGVRYLQKPFSEAALAEAVRGALAGSA